MKLSGADSILAKFKGGAQKDVKATATALEDDLFFGQDLPVQRIPLDSIERWDIQPRKYFAPDGLERLAQSFRASGFKGAILVRPKPDGEGYLIVFGERRWRAAKIAKLADILCVIEDMDDETALDLAMGENLIREDLSKLEETEGILAIAEVKTGLDRNRIIKLVTSQYRYMEGATYVGRNEEAARHLPTICEILKRYGIALMTFRTKNLGILKLPDDLRTAHLEDKLDYSKALAIGKLKNLKDRTSILKKVKNGTIKSLTEVKAAVKKISQQKDRTSDDLSMARRTRFRGITARVGAAKTWRTINQDVTKVERIDEILAELESFLSD